MRFPFSAGTSQPAEGLFLSSDIGSVAPWIPDASEQFDSIATPLLQPALWPMLNHHPMPSMDPDDPSRWFLELFGPESLPSQVPYQSAEPIKPNTYASQKDRCSACPASWLQSLPGRR